MLVRLQRKWNHCTLMVEMGNDATAVENNISLPQIMIPHLLMILGIYTKNWKQEQIRYIYTNVHSIVGNSQKVETTQIFIDKWIKVIYTCNLIYKVQGWTLKVLYKWNYWHKEGQILNYYMIAFTWVTWNRKSCWWIGEKWFSAGKDRMKWGIIVSGFSFILGDEMC